VLHHQPWQQSGGEQPRVSLARRLVTKPRVTVAHEPPGKLDSRTSDEIMVLLQGLNDRGLTIVLVTHEYGVARFAQRLVHFKDGFIVGDEPVRDRRVEVSR